MKKENNEKAFTLTELLVVITIVSVLSVVTVLSLNTTQKDILLQESASQLVQDIRRVQEMAMSAKEFQGRVPQGGYGVYFEEVGQNKYILFADCNQNHQYDITGTPCNGFSEKMEEKTLSTNIEISEVSPFIPLNIIFLPPDPTVFITGDSASAYITLTNGFQQKTIILNKGGLISLQ